MDTSPEIEAMQFKFYREAPTWRKMEMMAGLHRMARTLSMSGLRQRHPEATDVELRRRLAEMLLGPELAAHVYAGGNQPEQAQNE